MLSVGTIVGGAFGLIRDRFGSVLVWGLLYGLATFAMTYFIMSSMAPMMAMDENADPNLAVGAIAGLFGQMMLFYLAFFVLYTVLLTAAQRAVLRPEESGFAYLRFGGDELRQIGLWIILGIMFSGIYMVSAFFIFFLTAGAVGGGSAGLGIAAIVAGIAILCFLVFLWVRVSLAFPLTLLRERIVLGEAWRLSRGHFWTLFGGYFVLGLTIVAIAIVISLVIQGDVWGDMLTGGPIDPAQYNARMQAQYAFGTTTILSLLFGALYGGAVIALTGGSIASAAQALDADHEGMARTFA